MASLSICSRPILVFTEVSRVFSLNRFLCLTATNSELGVYAYAAAQAKKAMEVTHYLGEKIMFSGEAMRVINLFWTQTKLCEDVPEMVPLDGVIIILQNAFQMHGNTIVFYMIVLQVQLMKIEEELFGQCCIKH